MGCVQAQVDDSTEKQWEAWVTFVDTQVRDYVSKHNIEERVSDAVKALLQEMPSDPTEFLCTALRGVDAAKAPVAPPQDGGDPQVQALEARAAALAGGDLPPAPDVRLHDAPAAPRVGGELLPCPAAPAGGETHDVDLAALCATGVAAFGDKATPRRQHTATGGEFPSLPTIPKFPSLAAVPRHVQVHPLRHADPAAHGCGAHEPQSQVPQVHLPQHADPAARACPLCGDPHAPRGEAGHCAYCAVDIFMGDRTGPPLSHSPTCEDDASSFDEHFLNLSLAIRAEGAVEAFRSVLDRLDSDMAEFIMQDVLVSPLSEAALATSSSTTEN